MKRHVEISATVCLLLIAAVIGCGSMYATPGVSDGTDFLDSGLTASGQFRAIQIDPRAEDSAGPQFAAVGDFDNDGRLDIASAWNESQPVQIHMQQRTDDGEVVFATIPIGGTTPIARMSGLRVADVDNDGFDDIVLLVKDTGLVARCDESRDDCDVTENGGLLENAVSGAIMIFFNSRDVYNEPWTGTTLTQSQLAGTDEGTLPEEGGYTGIDVGDIDGDGDPDIVVAINRAEGDPAIDDFVNSIDFYPNPGGGTARNGEGWTRIPIHGDLPSVNDCRIADVDGDGDNDIIATFPNAKNANVRWLPNPLSYGTVSAVYGLWPAHAPIGHIATEANTVDLGDIDGDGNVDVIVRSANGKVVQWFKKPNQPSQTYIRNPWQVYSIAEFSERAPNAVALGDLNNDGAIDAAIAAEGAVAWFTPYDDRFERVFDFWAESLLIDDSPDDGNDDPSGGLTDLLTDPMADPEAATGTLVNCLIVVDVDGDGYNDIIATLDRTALSGLSNDALVMFRNTLGD